MNRPLHRNDAAGVVVRSFSPARTAGIWEELVGQFQDVVGGGVEIACQSDQGFNRQLTCTCFVLRVGVLPDVKVIRQCPLRQIIVLAKFLKTYGNHFLI